MPFIHVRTNTAIPKDKEQAVKTGLGKAISTIPGKSEQWLMVNITPESALYFQGSDAPAAMVEVQVYGGASGTAYDAMTGKISGILTENLGIPANRIYVSYHATPDWGWNGGNF